MGAEIKRGRGRPRKDAATVENLAGRVFRSLTVLEYVARPDDLRGRRHWWLCTCSECGNVTVLPTGVLVNTNQRTCGCAKRGRKLGSGTPGDRRQCPEYYTWVKAVYARDNYACVKCGASGTGLHAHHIEPFHKCIEKRWIIENGVSWCPGCHRNFHTKYGNSAGIPEYMQYMQDTEIPGHLGAAVSCHN